MLESEMIKAIETHTQKTGEMPTRLCGRFEQLLPINGFCYYVSFMGREGYRTPFGIIECELDTKASEWYVR